MNYVEGRTLHNVIFSDETQVCYNYYTFKCLCITLLMLCNGFLNTTIILQVTYEEKVCVSRQISQAIVFMHTATPPVVHLDIKPENVLVRLEQLNFNLRLLLLLL